MVAPEKMTRLIILRRDVEGTYAHWANFENFPRFMKYIKSVRRTGPKTSHWIMQGPLGKDLEWNAETTMEEENKRIAWHSIDGDIKTSGQVTFADLGNGSTQVTVQMQYKPPAGVLGRAAARLFDNPEAKLDEDLWKFKKYVELPSHAR